MNAVLVGDGGTVEQTVYAAKFSAMASIVAAIASYVGQALFHLSCQETSRGQTLQ